jgi:hypothetical protein
VNDPWLHFTLSIWEFSPGMVFSNGRKTICAYCFMKSLRRERQKSGRDLRFGDIPLLLNIPILLIGKEALKCLK